MASPGVSPSAAKAGPATSLHSASLGAGRIVSRTKPLQAFTWSAKKKLLTEREVVLLSAGLDEVPGVYKDIATAMAAQTDLVDVIGRFDSRLVKMCPAGERAKD
jgi:tRNA-splicing ligase RtcB (3'-phosphate/5'-hydroxy nucleic acid ligase)